LKPLEQFTRREIFSAVRLTPSFHLRPAASARL
jgi:hypothetical protein